VDLVLYTRRGCHLCAEAEEMLVVLGLEARLVDVDADAVVRDRYGLRVPVLELDGRPVAEGRFREDELVARLRGATGRG
jgi:glutaredoxin